MSRVTVFVDDAVQGHLPMVCTSSGEPADGLHRVEQSMGPSAWVFLLIFLGPIGWIVLIALNALSKTLTVRLPKTCAVVRRETRSFRFALLGVAVMAASGMAAMLLRQRSPRSPTDQTLLVAAVIVAVIATIAALYCIGTYLGTRVGVSLDASGRWVTLRNVHPAFVDAVHARRHRDTTLDAP